MQKVTELVTNLTNTIMPSNLPKSYKVAVFKENGKPLTFEDRELQLPKDGEVLHTRSSVLSILINRLRS